MNDKKCIVCEGNGFISLDDNNNIVGKPETQPSELDNGLRIILAENFYHLETVSESKLLKVENDINKWHKQEMCKLIDDLKDKLYIGNNENFNDGYKTAFDLLKEKILKV